MDTAYEDGKKMAIIALKHPKFKNKKTRQKYLWGLLNNIQLGVCVHATIEDKEAIARLSDELMKIIKIKMKTKTMAELQKDFDDKVLKLRESCNHKSVNVELDHSVIGRGSNTDAIHIICNVCEKKIYIHDFEDGKNKKNFIKAVEKGKITFTKEEWEKMRFDMFTSAYTDDTCEETKEVLSDGGKRIMGKLRRVMK